MTNNKIPLRVNMAIGDVMRDQARMDQLQTQLAETKTKLVAVVAAFDAWLASEDEDRIAEWTALCGAISAAKRQTP